MTTSARPDRTKRPPHVCQFLIVLLRTDPLVWRRIQVRSSYSFWDLHVAIQDAMGWKDYHLHEFVVVDQESRRTKLIGIPDEDLPDERPCEASWEVPIARYFSYRSDPARYLYDFGDGWEHTVELEDALPVGEGRYPRCVGGAGACPPEDVGGTHGYAEFLEVISKPRHPERAAMLQWAGGAFDPHAFDPAAVRFDDPKKRWRRAFVETEADE